MIDREKVVKGLECCISEQEGCKGCPYKEQGECEYDGYNFKAIKDAIALLKGQEPIAPSICGSNEPDGHGSWWYLCGKCKKPIDHKDRFCKRCGQAVKWQ